MLGTLASLDPCRLGLGPPIGAFFHVQYISGSRADSQESVFMYSYLLALAEAKPLHIFMNLLCT